MRSAGRTGGSGRAMSPPRRAFKHGDARLELGKPLAPKLALLGERATDDIDHEISLALNMALHPRVPLRGGLNLALGQDLPLLLFELGFRGLARGVALGMPVAPFR
jgi:hypothetical protein